MKAENDAGPSWTRSTLDRDYWISQCIGFTVESNAGRVVGVVEELRFQSRADRPDYLIVRAGRFGRRHLVIAESDVDAIVPREKRIRLSETSQR
jgi:PRC-barrel domain